MLARVKDFGDASRYFDVRPCPAEPGMSAARGSSVTERPARDGALREAAPHPRGVGPPSEKEARGVSARSAGRLVRRPG
jgi:hypothetical protein